MSRLEKMDDRYRDIQRPIGLLDCYGIKKHPDGRWLHECTVEELVELLQHAKNTLSEEVDK